MQSPSTKIKAIIAIILLIIIAAVIYKVTEKEPELPKMTVQEKKARFKSLIVPAVDTVYAELMARYQKVKATVDAGGTNDDIEALKVEYKASNNEELLLSLIHI